MRARNAGIGVQVAQLIIGIFCIGCWIGNMIKLVQCDWSPSGNWKGEIVHAIGLVGPASVVTVWFSDK